MILSEMIEKNLSSRLQCRRALKTGDSTIVFYRNPCALMQFLKRFSDSEYN